MSFDPAQFVEKYKLAVKSAQEQKPEGGLNGFELEWNLLDEELRPLLTVGAGPARQSFVDYLRSHSLHPWLAKFSQLEAAPSIRLSRRSNSLKTAWRRVVPRVSR